MAYLIHIRMQSHPVRTEAFAFSPIRVGRNPLNELVIDDPAISQWHGVFHFQGDQGWYVDAGSTNGSEVNGQRALGNEPIALSMTHRDAITLGSAVLSVAQADVPPSMLSRGRTSSFNPGEGGATVVVEAGGATRLLSAPSVVHTAVDRAESPGLVAEDILAALERTRPAYEHYRQAWEEVRRQVEARLETSPPGAKGVLLQNLLLEFPMLAWEPEFTAMADAIGLELNALMPTQMHEWLQRLATGSSEGAEASLGNVARGRAFERVGAALETQGEAFTQLRQGYAHFAKELGLEGAAPSGGVRSAESGRELIRYLFDWDADGFERLEELKRAYADVAIHQIAVIQGVMAGARALLQELAPEAGAQAIEPRSEGFLSRLLPFRAARLYREMRDRHRTAAEEDRFARVLFGPAFARAYFAVTGSQGGG